jgi:hypothetical protein
VTLSTYHPTLLLPFDVRASIYLLSRIIAVLCVPLAVYRHLIVTPKIVYVLAILIFAIEVLNIKAAITITLYSSALDFIAWCFLELLILLEGRDVP